MKGKGVLLPVAVLIISATLFISGCSDNFWDPTQIGRFRPTPAVNVILPSLGVAEEEPSAWENAEEPKPIDAMVYDTDYVFAPGDVVRVSIFELLEIGRPYDDQYVVTETGNISIPYAGNIQVEGLTETGLEEEIRDVLSPSILKEPSVTVILVNSQQRAFSILGDGIPNPSRYNIPRYDFRLNEALATAGGISEFNISYIYVSRKITGREAVSQPAPQALPQSEEEYPELEEKTPELEPKLQQVPEQEMLEIIRPRARIDYRNRLVISSAEMATDEELFEAALPDGFAYKQDRQQEDKPESLPRERIEEPMDLSQAEDVEWIFKDGRYIPVRKGRTYENVPKPPAPEEFAGKLEEKESEQVSWEQIGKGGIETRLIKVPTDKLRSGDPRYNIIVRPGDTIQVPVDVLGEFWIGGNVNSQGIIRLTGRPMTLKMAIYAAGGLGPLAFPKRCEVVRRIGKDREEIVMVDLDKIARGEQPDFFIKPNDVINVGTHFTSRWRAVLRNAFRATYGFGFIYDRNFSDRDFGTSRPIPDWF